MLVDSPFPLNFKNSAFSPIEFKERLISFDISKWFTKPKWFSPYICAQRGWKCYKPHYIACVDCYRTLYVDPKYIESDSCEEELKKMFAELSAGFYHDSFCPWTVNPSPNRFLKPVKEWNYEKLSVNLSKFMSFNFQEAYFSTPEEVVRIAHVYLHHFSEITEKFDRRTIEYSLYLTLTHWTKQDFGVRCDYCNAEINNITARIPKKSAFNPIEAHRLWCP
ncbi:hypothetical protein HZS_7776, partial [Henneguya salminicola]